MLEEVEFKQEKDMFCISWIWSEDMESMEIKFKRSGSVQGEGTFFSKDSILRLPSIRTGSVKRRITSEWGLYDFSFTAVLHNGDKEQAGQYEEIMIGEKRRVCWKIEKKRGNAILLFPGNEFTVPAGVVCMAYRKPDGLYQLVLDKEVNDRTRLEFPDTNLLDCFEIFAKPPYDKAYVFQRL